MVLALVDRSQSTGREEISNPLRIANSNWADGSAPPTSPWSGSTASWSPSRSDGGRAIRWGGSSFGPGSSLASLSDSLVSGTWVRMGTGFSCLTTGLGLNTAGSGFRSASLADPPLSGLGLNAVFRCGRGGSGRTPVPPIRPSSLYAGIPLPSGHTGGEAGCLSLTRVSQASATISCVMDLSADDDEATARSLIGHMASATLRRPISCSSVAAATRPSLVLGDSSARMSRPGVWGNDVTGDATGPTSVIRSLDPPGLRVPPLQTGAMASAPVRRPGHGGRPVACSTRSAQPFLITPAAGTFVPPAVPRRASPSV